MIQRPDLELIKLVKEGNEAAFEHLLKRYEPLIAKIARSYYIQGYEKEDFYQIGSVAFYKAILNFNETEATFYAYALSCVRNEIVSQCRKQLTRVEYATDHEEIATVMESCEMYTVEKSEVLEEENNPKLHAYRTELKALLSEHSYLSAFEKQCLEGFANNLGYIEIAEKLGVDIKKVDNGLTRIRAKLRGRGY